MAPGCSASSARVERACVGHACAFTLARWLLVYFFTGNNICRKSIASQENASRTHRQYTHTPRMPTRTTPPAAPDETQLERLLEFQLQNGLSMLGSRHPRKDTIGCIAGAFLARNFVDDKFGRIAQQTGVTELAAHRLPTLGFVRVHQRTSDTKTDKPLCERILAAGGVEFCESREALLAGYLEGDEYLVLYLDVHAQATPACAENDADGVGNTDGLLLHPQTEEYAEFMDRMNTKPRGWRGSFLQRCLFLSPGQAIPLCVEKVSWKDIELLAPQPPIPVEHPGAPPHTRCSHMLWDCGHWWNCFFQGSMLLERRIMGMHELYAIVLLDLFDAGALSSDECHALTGLQLRGESQEYTPGQKRAQRNALLEAIHACQVAPKNPDENNHHAWVEVRDPHKRQYVVIEPAKTLFPHAVFSHTRYHPENLEKLAPGTYAKAEPTDELCVRMQEAVDELRDYLNTARASTDPDGPQIEFTGEVPLKLYAGFFQQMQAAQLEGSCSFLFTRFMLAYLRAWGYQARACIGSLAVRLPRRKRTLLYGTGRPQPEALRDVWDKLVGRHAGLFRERGVEVQELVHKNMQLADFMPKLYPEHLLRWARPTSHMLLPPVLPLRCEGCGLGGKLLLCARCRLVHYCSRACQLAHHPKHAPVCLRVVRAVAAVLKIDAELLRAPQQDMPANRRPRA